MVSRAESLLRRRQPVREALLRRLALMFGIGSHVVVNTRITEWCQPKARSPCRLTGFNALAHSLGGIQGPEADLAQELGAVGLVDLEL